MPSKNFSVLASPLSAPCSGLSGARLSVFALGCRTNLAEAEALASAFAARGAAIVQGGPCDVALIVTCSVTSVADRKSRQLIYRCRRENPNCCVAVCGCWAQGASEAEAQKMGVSLLVGNRCKSELPDLVERWLKNRAFVARKAEMSRDWDALQLERSPYYGRAFIKVQDGCDHRCTYCIVPALRGPSVSRPLGDILDEARRCVSNGAFELILTGVHLGLYGRDNGSSLAELVRAVSTVDGVTRLRFGSLEPFSIGDDLLDALASSNVFCRHLHLPLQSGDDEILRRMGRGHTAKDFLDLVSRLRSALGDDLHVSTDVLCAFPGESDAAFKNTLSVLKEARIGRIHAFRYSPRPGTPAAGFAGQISAETAASRMELLKRFAEKSLADEARRWLGRKVEVLFEGSGRGFSQGYTREYIEFRPAGGEKNEKIFNSLKNMTAESADGGILFGK